MANIRGGVGGFLLRRAAVKSVRQKYQTGPQFNKRKFFQFQRATTVFTFVSVAFSWAHRRNSGNTRASRIFQVTLERGRSTTSLLVRDEQMAPCTPGGSAVACSYTKWAESLKHLSVTVVATGAQPTRGDKRGQLGLPNVLQVLHDNCTPRDGERYMKVRVWVCVCETEKRGILRPAIYASSLWARRVSL
ncbi:hypothetical protein TcBrA4_0075760 [Trypanosoma cruzi]|nr:hypothetical protein TcBrA4_0075760 [Trypanosoma cruzi]